jgi:hypothetical protein
MRRIKMELLLLLMLAGAGTAIADDPPRYSTPFCLQNPHIEGCGPVRSLAKDYARCLDLIDKNNPTRLEKLEADRCVRRFGN